MGNADNTGLQGRISGEREECSSEWSVGSNGPFNPREELANDWSIRSGESLGWGQSKQLDQDGCKWIVSRPGQSQQAWEHPRVISRKVESAVGLSAHGYHFREDILRALGNSVYEDTAELAFRDLLRNIIYERAKQE